MKGTFALLGMTVAVIASPVARQDCQSDVSTPFQISVVNQTDTKRSLERVS